jgi:adenylosuccinate lyase
MPLDPLTAVSSVDGRYRSIAEELAPYFSEYALIRSRVIVECEYLIALSSLKELGIRELTSEEKTALRKLRDVSLEDARIVKKIEREGHGGIPATNHDVKAVEYFIKYRLKETSLEDISEWVHFALTSEDVNSVAHAMALRSVMESVILGALSDIESRLTSVAKENAETPMLARTHGQSASPTTFGKEMKIFAKRIERQVEPLKRSSILVKFGGATGNWNAHMVAAPGVNWLSFARSFIESLNGEDEGKAHFIRIVLNDTTTQIEPHDTYAELFDAMRRINTILLDLSQDMWRYVSDGWIAQKPREGEIGSSAMPHKINPIDFENAEGNLGVANALFEHFSRKLPVSRLQRDLSDSTVERVFGTAFAHSLIAYRSLVRGFEKTNVDAPAMLESLQAHPEVLAEAFQTALRRAGVAVPYEKVKELTRGRKVSLEDFSAFIDSLGLPEEDKTRLKALRPEIYTGLANLLARK